MTDYGYLLPGDTDIPVEMRIVEGLVPYVVDDDGNRTIVWPLGYFEGDDTMDEIVRRYTWRMEQNLTDMKANAFQLIGGIDDAHSVRLRELINDMEILVQEIRRA